MWICRIWNGKFMSLLWKVLQTYPNNMYMIELHGPFSSIFHSYSSFPDSQPIKYKISEWCRPHPRRPWVALPLQHHDTTTLALRYYYTCHHTTTTLPPYIPHTTLALPLHYPCTTSTLPLQYLHTTATLPLPPHYHDTTTTLPPSQSVHYPYITSTLPLHYR